MYSFSISDICSVYYCLEELSEKSSLSRIVLLKSEVLLNRHICGNLMLLTGTLLSVQDGIGQPVPVRHRHSNTLWIYQPAWSNKSPVFFPLFLYQTKNSSRNRPAPHLLKPARLFRHPLTLLFSVLTNVPYVHRQAGSHSRQERDSQRQNRSQP